MKRCVVCGKETLSVIHTDTGDKCYNCLGEEKNPSRKMKRKISHEEADIQSEFFNKVFLLYPQIPRKLLFAVPNGGSRNAIEAINLKRQGTTAGVSDVILLIPQREYASLCIEFKTSKGKQSQEQIEFQKQAEMYKNKYIVVRSVGEALNAVGEYINDKKKGL